MVPLFGVLIEHQVTAHDVGVVTGKLCFDKGLCNVLPVFCNEHQAGQSCTDIFCSFEIVGEHGIAEQLTADPVRRAAGNIQQILQLIRLHLMLDTRLRNKIFRKYKANGYAGVEAIFERDQRNQKFIWGMYDRICGMFCRKTR